MREDRIYPAGQSPVSTFAYHEHRDRAPHLEQEYHRGRLLLAARMIGVAAEDLFSAGEPAVTVSDLGCGDGGLLSLLKNISGLYAWGCDFAPANAAGWAERGVDAAALDVFGADHALVQVGQIVVMTEVLEHLEDPHDALSWALTRGARYLVCSSPWNESLEMHDPSHAWAWDLEGYARMIEAAGWTIVRQEQVETFQVVMAVNATRGK
jgi:SAM-dependent methyltransferase